MEEAVELFAVCIALFHSEAFLVHALEGACLVVFGACLRCGIFVANNFSELTLVAGGLHCLLCAEDVCEGFAVEAVSTVAAVSKFEYQTLNVLGGSAHGVCGVVRVGCDNLFEVCLCGGGVLTVLDGVGCEFSVAPDVFHLALLRGFVAL